MYFNKKRGQVWDSLIPWLVGAGVLVLGFIAYSILTGKGANAWNYLKDLLRLG